MKVVLIIICALMIILNVLAAFASAFCVGLAIIIDDRFLVVYNGFMCLFNICCVFCFRAMLCRLVARL
jgi:hypothetical protein